MGPVEDPHAVIFQLRLSSGPGGRPVDQWTSAIWTNTFSVWTNTFCNFRSTEDPHSVILQLRLSSGPGGRPVESGGWEWRLPELISEGKSARRVYFLGVLSLSYSLSLVVSQVSSFALLGHFIFCLCLCQLMSPHHSNQMSQRLQVSWIALCMSKVKVPSVSELVTE